MMSMRIRGLYCCLATALLSACGGGGGGGSSTVPASSNSANTSSNTTITASNQDQVSAGALYAVSTAATGSAISGSIASVAQVGDTSGSPAALPGAVETAMRQAELALKRSIPGHASIASTSSSTSACTGGGTATSKVNYTDPNAFTAGDSISITYANCIDSGVTQNGSVAVTISSVSGNFNPNGSAGLTVSFSGFSTASGSSSEVIDGSASMTLNASSSKLDFTLTSTSLSASAISNGKSASFKLNGVNFGVSDDLVSKLTFNPMTMSFSATLPNFSAVAGVSLVTPVVTDYDGNYLSGKIKITGNASALYITFKGAGSVTVDLDNNNDGVIDATKTTTLTTLMSL